ncbi:MAG: tetratricopeptide repeat protein [Gemmatimonadota bacterium]
MTVKWPKGAPVGAVLFVALALPSPLLAQEDCVRSGNQHTRGADVEFSWANRRDDPQTKEERYARALKKLRTSFELEPDEPRAYLLAGRAYLGLRDFVGADTMLNRLVQMEPKCAEQAEQMRFNAWVTQYNLGIARWQAGDPDTALEAFETANLIYRDPRSLVNAASLYQNAGNLDKARALYRSALDVGGEPDMVRVASINLAELLKADGKNEEALAIYSEYSEKNPDDVLGRLNYAIALMDVQRTEEAQALFQELLSRDDLTFRQWSEVGVGLYRAGDYAQAVTAFERAHEMQPLNKEVLENLANTRYQSDRYQDLLPIAEQLVERYPYESVNYALLANAHRELGNEEKALAVLQRRDALPFEFLRVQLVAQQSENTYTIEGEALNRTAPAESKFEVPFEFLGEGGEVVLSDVLLLELPAEGESSSFQLQVQAGQPIAGFRYRLAPATASGS